MQEHALRNLKFGSCKKNFHSLQRCFYQYSRSNNYSSKRSPNPSTHSTQRDAIELNRMYRIRHA